MDTTNATTVGQYEVHESRKAWLVEKLEKLNRKAEKLGVPGVTLTWTGEKLVEYKNAEGETTGEADRYLLLTVEGVAPAVGGWTFVATLNHAEEAGTVIRSIPGFEGKIPSQFRTASRFVCEHCNKIRNRRDTYLLQNEAGEFKQVGANCLGDFLGGRDPHAIAAWAHLEYVVNETCGSAGGGLGADRRVYLSTWFGHVAAVIRVETRWTSRAASKAYSEASGGEKVLRASADIASQTLFAQGQKERAAVAQWQPQAEDFAFGEAALAWAKETFHSKAADERSDFEHNLVVATSSEALTVKNLGIAAAAVGLYRRHLDRETERALRAEIGAKSEHIGAVGERLVFWAKLAGTVRTLDGQFGTTYLYKLISREGNLLTWFGSSEIEELKEGGDFVALIGTVKKHDIFREEKQTVVSRVAVATQKQIDKATGADKVKKAQAKAEKAVAKRFEQLSNEDW
jgi:hypothetical protein